MKNERPNTGRNLLKRERYRPEHKQLHQIPNWGVAICTGIQQTILSQARGSLHAPPQRIPQGWKGGSPEGGEGGIRKSRRPHSLVPPQGAIKSTRTTWYSNTGEARKNSPSQTSFPYKKTKEISRLQVKQAVPQCTLTEQVRWRRTARYWMPRHPRTCRAEHTPTAGPS